MVKVGAFISHKMWWNFREKQINEFSVRSSFISFIGGEEKDGFSTVGSGGAKGICYRKTSTFSIMYAAKMLHAGYNNAILISIKSSKPATFP